MKVLQGWPSLILFYSMVKIQRGDNDIYPRGDNEIYPRGDNEI